MDSSGASASWTKKIFSAGMSSMPAGSPAAGEDVEGVQAGAHVGVVRQFHDPPGVLVGR